MRLIFYIILLLGAPQFASAQGSWIEWLDMQAEINGGMHAAYLPTRINAATNGSIEFSDTSVINPGLQLSALVMPIANKYVGFGWHWHRAEGYAAVSSHSIRQKGVTAYIGHPRFKFVYHTETIDRFVNLYRIEYGTALSGTSEWFGRSAYENIGRQTFGFRLTTSNTTELEFQFHREYWSGIGRYNGFGLVLNTPQKWQYAATFFLDHPARGVNLAPSLPTIPLPQSSPMAMLTISKRLLFKSNYAKMLKYGL